MKCLLDALKLLCVIEDHILIFGRSFRGAKQLDRGRQLSLQLLNEALRALLQTEELLRRTDHMQKGIDYMLLAQREPVWMNGSVFLCQNRAPQSLAILIDPMEIFRVQYVPRDHRKRLFSIGDGNSDGEMVGR